MALAAGKLKADFPSHVLVDTLRELLKQTERTCLGLLSFISFSSRSCFVVWGMLFDFFGIFVSNDCVQFT